MRRKISIIENSVLPVGVEKQSKSKKGVVRRGNAINIAIFVYSPSAYFLSN